MDCVISASIETTVRSSGSSTVESAVALFKTGQADLNPAAPTRLLQSSGRILIDADLDDCFLALQTGEGVTVVGRLDPDDADFDALRITRADGTVLYDRLEGDHSHSQVGCGLRLELVNDLLQFLGGLTLNELLIDRL